MTVRFIERFSGSLVLYKYGRYDQRDVSLLEFLQKVGLVICIHGEDIGGAKLLGFYCAAYPYGVPEYKMLYGPPEEYEPKHHEVHCWTKLKFKQKELKNGQLLYRSSALCGV